MAAGEPQRQRPAPEALPTSLGFRSSHLRGVRPTEIALKKEKEILAPFCYHGVFPQDDVLIRLERDFKAFPRLVAEACAKHRVTMEDLQSIMLPPWGLHWGLAFMSREELFAAIDRDEQLNHLGEVMDLDLPGTEMDIPNDGMVVRSGRWAELMDGTAIIRLMSGSTPTSCRMWANVQTIGAALASLREVPWSPSLHWAFPAEYRRRVVVLYLLGMRLGLRRVWPVVMSFFARLSKDECQAAVRGKMRPGQLVEYYSKSNGGWMPCRVAATDPIVNCVMVDIKPNYWMNAAEQATHIREPQINEVVARQAVAERRRYM